MIFQFVIVGASLLGLLLGIVVLQASYLTWALRWNNNNTNRLNYFGKSASQRGQFKIWLGLHRTLLKPWMTMASRIQNFSFETATSTNQGIGFPKGTCTEQSIEAAINYVPTEQDVFVVSQMKSGTTWLQQLVIQVLNRGSSYVDAERPLAAVSSWLESEKTVPLDLAPLIGSANDGPSRVIKTHFAGPIVSYECQSKIHLHRKGILFPALPAVSIS